MNCGVVEAIYVAAVDIPATDSHRVCTFSLAHGVSLKISVGCMNDREIGSVNWGVYKNFPRAELKESGVI